jgi:crotonobetainyl-CoA:carnitine CoA-transferase CaiB-like acyl-CoA transferase
MAADRPDLAEDPRFADISARTRHIGELYELQAEIVAARDTAYWLDLCDRLEIPAAPINRLQDLESDPHLQSVDFFVPLESASGSRYRFPRNPVRLQHSHVPAAMPPRLGEHTRDVLRQAGLDEALIAELLETGAARDALSATIDNSKDPA